jgi:uncharacterized protein YndB with AHSA1/START domain
VSVAEPGLLRVERTIEGSAEEAFDAWTNPEVLRRWWCADPNGSTPVADVDLRPGGAYRLAMRSSGGDEHIVVGEYRDVQRPRALTYTWAWEGADGSRGPESVVTVTFTESGAATTIVIEHRELATDESRVAHGHGWEACLDSLQQRVFAGAPRSA